MPSSIKEVAQSWGGVGVVYSEVLISSVDYIR